MLDWFLLILSPCGVYVTGLAIWLICMPGIHIADTSMGWVLQVFLCLRDAITLEEVYDSQLPK